MPCAILQIIMQTIMVDDIYPFLIFAAVMIAAFESSGQFFSWIVDNEHVAWSFFRTFTTIGDESLKITPEYGALRTTPCVVLIDENSR